MRRPRIVLPAAAPGRLVDLPPEEARHLGRVLRRGPGDEVVVLAAEGRAWRAVLEESDGGRLRARVLEVAEAAVEVFPWRVAVGLVKGTGLDPAVRLASELGLEALVPLVCARSQVRAEGSGRPERWARIAREAAKQCGRARPLEVAVPRALPEALAGEEAGTVWLVEPGGPRPDPERLAGPEGPRPALFLVGPEGGFSDEERTLARERGARPLGLPVPVLRTPNAVCLLAALGVWAASLPGRAGP